MIGSGPIVIGQACEFDYSGTQACRVLRAEGIRVILVNSNPATIMTDPEFADATYIEPITPEVVEKVIAQERPDAILPTLGGQTALNTASRLHEAGVLEQLRRRADRRQHRRDRGGRGPPAVQGDRGRLRRARCPAPGSATRWPTAWTAAADLGFPVVVRPSFTMGGLGSGIAYDEADLHRIAGRGLQTQPDHRGAARGVDPRLEGVRARADARPQRQRRGGLLDRERRPDGRAHRRLGHRGAGDDADRPGVPAAARPRRSRSSARSASTPAAATSSSRSNPRRRPDGRDRDEPAGVPVHRAGVQGDRLPDRQDRGPAGHRLHARRDPQRHHPGRPRRASSRPWTTWWSRFRGSRSRSSPARTRR